MKLSLSFIERRGYAVASPLQDQQKMPKKETKIKKTRPHPHTFHTNSLYPGHTPLPHIIVYYTRRNELFFEPRACHVVWIGRLSESRCAAAHDLALAYQLGVELGAVEREVDVEVDAVEGALWGVHALEVLLEVLSRQVRSERDDFLDT